ncbi:MAG: hypothetical protein R3A52_26235 [Polyangiales bacterium]
MRSPLLARVLFACLLSPSALWAQSRVEPAPSTLVPREPPLRFGVAGTVSGGRFAHSSDPAPQGDVWVAGPGVAIDLGVQFNDRLAAYAHGLAASCVFLSAGALEAMVEYSPTPLYSVALGVGWTGFLNLPFDSDSSARAKGWSGLSIPMIVALNLGAGRQPSGRVAAFRLGGEAAVGISPGSGDSALRVSFNIGYVSM